MSPLLPNMGGRLAATHAPVDPGTLMRLRDVLRQKSAGNKISVAMIEAIAVEEKVPRAQVLAAVATDPNLVVEMTSDVLFAVCVGGCQLQGALDNVEELLRLREQRVQAGQKSFDLVPRHCLDMCPHSPVAVSRSSHGMAAHPKLKPDGIAEIVNALCD